MNDRILDYLARGGPALKSEICLRFRISRGHAEELLGDLGERGLVRLDLPSRLWRIARADKQRAA